MEFSVIDIIFIVLSIFVIGALIWFGIIISKKSSKEDEELRADYNKKRELVSQVPLLKERIEFLEKNSENCHSSLEISKSKISEQEIIVAQKQKDIDNLSFTKNKIQNEFDLTRKNFNTLVTENRELQIEKSILRTQLKIQAEGNQKLQEDFDEQSKRLELKLNQIMQQTLDSKIKKFDETSLKSMDGILKPFKENLDAFRKRIEDSQENSTKKFAELSKEIELVTKAGMHIGKEAENLTKALKGKKQTQGSWGEMILESVLEYSGLHKGTHYETQESYKDEAGKTKRPDVVIKLPQDRSIIIDSKVSLNDYERYIRADSDEERNIAAKAVVSAFKNHIDTLNSKNYAHYKIGTLQYVFMFVPIEGAFALAISENPGLYEYALNKHIAIVNPSTLTVSLRTIYLYWQSEQASSNALQMFNVAGKLYDKMVIFSDNFSKIGDQLQSVNSTYEKAKNQLAYGSGNLMKKVDELKELGAKTTKSLKNSKLDYQDFDEEEVEVEFFSDNELEKLSVEK